MSLLLLIVGCAAIGLLWQEVRRLRDRVETLEDWFTASAAPVAAVPSQPVYVPLEPLPDLVDAEYRPAKPIAEPVVSTPAPIAELPQQAFLAEPAAIEIPPPSSRFEDVFGRRLPIWAGGLTLAVAGVLVVRYSIEAGLFSPWVQVMFGLVFGAGLIGGAELAMRREAVVRDPRVRQSLAGAGIATLYAVTLAATHLYDLIGPGTAFVAMALVTGLAGALALRFGAPSALLGLMGGLAAPALVGAGEPNVPLLTLYLALTVGGLCALGRQQRWWWLGALALAGGFGWGALLILGGALDLAAALSVGLYTLALAIALPLLLACDRAALLRVAAAVLGCAQLAALVALGGFAPLDWGLFGLISLAILWLSRREPLFADIPALALGVAILLGVAWPAPTVAGMGALLTALVAIHAVPAALRVWREDARPVDAPMVAAVAVAIGVLPALHFDHVGFVALVGAALAVGVAARGWRAAGRADDTRFATLVITAAGSLALAAAQMLPFAGLASAAALLCAAMMTLAGLADDRRIERAGWVFGTATMALLGVGEGMGRLFGEAGSGQIAAWIVPAMAGLGLAIRSTGTRAAVMQPAAALIGYGAMAQLVSASMLPLVPVVMLCALAVSRRATVQLAALAAGAIATGWTIVPLVAWAASALIAATGAVMLVDAWPSLGNAFLRIALPGGHGVWFTGIVLNPLVEPQQAGPWLALSYAIMGGLLWVMPRLIPAAVRQRDGALMLLIVVAAFTLLRQVSHTPMPLRTGTGAGEQIARSILALVLAGAFLCIGIVRRARDWRLASLALMLVAVVKVFLFDAAGLDGLARIASFAALGFSLIGVGWLYSRYLPDETR